MKPLSANLRKVLTQVLVLAVAVFILILLARLVEGVKPAEVVRAVAELSDAQVMLAVGLTALGYAWLIGYDYLALRFLKRQVPPPRLVFTSLASFALQRNIGPAPITGGAVRYRYYRRYGFSPADGALLATLCGLFFGMGIVMAGGLSLLIQPAAMARVVNLPGWALRLSGAAMLIGLVGYLWWSHAREHPIRIGNWQAPPPSIRLASLQLLFGLIDLCLVSAVLYVLLPQQVEIGYVAFIGLYVVAVLAGAVSHVPGGLGVFESVLLLLLPGDSTSALLGSLLAFRGIYYLLPLATMTVVAGVYEIGHRLVPARVR